jgi:hypothetical protein
MNSFLFLPLFTNVVEEDFYDVRLQEAACYPPGEHYLRSGLGLLGPGPSAIPTEFIRNSSLSVTLSNRYVRRENLTL